MRMIGEGVRRSPTFRRLVETVERSDVVVYIEPTRDVPRGARAYLRYAGASLVHRFVRVAVQVPCSSETFIALLGHELEHATEVAAEHSVRDDAGLEALYRRIGYQVAAGWETHAAVAAGETVLDELRRGTRNAVPDAAHQ